MTNLAIELFVLDKKTNKETEFRLPMDRDQINTFNKDGYEITDWDTRLEIADNLSLGMWNSIAKIIKEENISTVEDLYDYLQDNDPNWGCDIPAVYDYDSDEDLDALFKGLTPSEILKSARGINYTDDVLVKDYSTGEVWTLANRKVFFDYYNYDICQKFIEYIMKSK